MMLCMVGGSALGTKDHVSPPDYYTCSSKKPPTQIKIKRIYAYVVVPSLLSLSLSLSSSNCWKWNWCKDHDY